MKKISIILPCFKEAENVRELVPLIIRNIPKKYNYEIIIVDDGSDDETPFLIESLAKRNRKIKGILFYRRFGHMQALKAGIDFSKGDAVVTMDADFQHPPDVIPEAVVLWEKGHDLVLMQKNQDFRKRKALEYSRSAGYEIWKWLTDGLLLPGISEFRLIDRKIVNIISSSEEREPFLRGLVNLAARNPVVMSYKLGKRKFGRSAYTPIMILNTFINGLISFSTKPLRVMAAIGLVIGILSLVFLTVDTLAAVFLGRKLVAGYLTIVFLMAFLNGFIIFYLGVLGEYIGVIFREVKKRPGFYIDRKFNL